jgi:hypothetical protein
VLGPNSSTPRRVEPADRAKRAIDEPQTATECPPPLSIGEEGEEGPLGPGGAPGAGAGPLGPSGCAGLMGAEGADEACASIAAAGRASLRAAA